MLIRVINTKMIVDRMTMRFLLSPENGVFAFVNALKLEHPRLRSRWLLKKKKIYMLKKLPNFLDLVILKSKK